MNKAELMRKMDEIISLEDNFVENLAAIDLTSVKHSEFRVTVFLRLKNDLTKLMDDSRRHREILTSMKNILSGDPRDEY